MTRTFPSGSRAPGADRAAPFDPEQESEYVRTRLLNARTLIRMACLLALAITGLRIAEFAVARSGIPSFPDGFVMLFPVVVLSASLLLAWFAWSRQFERYYLPVATLAVPIRNIFGGIAIAAMAAHGRVELLMLLPAMMLSPFFFLGLRFRTALVCVVLTIAAFAISALLLALPTAILLRSCGFLLVTAATSAVAAWHLEGQSRRSFLDGRLLAHLAEHDALTGTKNRRAFDEHLSRLWQRAVEDGQRLAVLLVDVDHFKAYNDRYGHQAGDASLQEVSQALQAQVCRPLDLLARYGGEEFAVVLYDIDGRHARDIAERMRQAVCTLGRGQIGSRATREVTISIGIAAIQPSPERGPRGAMQLADEALYAAKTGGRNRVHLATESDYGQLQTGIFVKCIAGG